MIDMKVTNKQMRITFLVLAVAVFIIYPPIQTVFLNSQTDIIWKLTIETRIGDEPRGFGPIIPLWHTGTSGQASSFEFDIYSPMYEMMCLYVGNLLLLGYVMLLAKKKWIEV